jgi:hypothetical protein
MAENPPSLSKDDVSFFELSCIELLSFFLCEYLDDCTHHPFQPIVREMLAIAARTIGFRNEAAKLKSEIFSSKFLISSIP